MLDGILSAIGSTPLVPLKKIFPEIGFKLFAKLESLNPGGSIKDRPALSILRAALEEGLVRPGGVVVESSSGNMGIGLAQACRYLGLQLICVVDSKSTAQNIRILEAYGARVEKVSEPDPESGELLQARIKRVRSLLEANPGSFWPNQYANAHNPAAHNHTTMREVAEALNHELDYLFVATSTCGTIRGCGDYCHDNGMDTKIVAVDARGSRIFSNESAERSIPGIGAGLVPDHLRRDRVDEVVHVDDLDCIRGCRLLMEREAIFAGGSSGGVVAAVWRLLDRVPAGASCVAILPDRGDRYLDTVFCDDWVQERYGRDALVAPGWGEAVGATVGAGVASARVGGRD